MDNKLYIYDLKSYKEATSDEKKEIFNLEKNYYDFEKIKDEYVKDKLKEFVIYRTEKTSVREAYRCVFLYNKICDFFNDYFPRICLQHSSKEAVLNKYKTYLLSQGKSVFKVYEAKHDGKERKHNTHSYNYLKWFLQFVYREKDDEHIIYTKDFPQMGNSHIHHVKYFNLGKISQEQMRSEVRDAVLFSTTYRTAQTIKGYITSANIFSRYIEKKYPNIKSCGDIKKQHISEYIIYLKMETGYTAKTYCAHIGNLKMILEDIGMIYDYGKFDTYFSHYEYMKSRQKIGRLYSQYELQRFNQSIKLLDKQVARCIMLHQLLGTRISDTLLLEATCLEYRDGKPIIRIRQAKVNRFMEKPINKEIVRLIEKSIEYTKDRYGDTKYIFVSNKNPNLPLSYNSLKYSIEEMIRKSNLKDDSGAPLFFGTHVFRRYYGKKLTELHIDDITISKLLGHAGLQCVDRYRKMGNKRIAEETKPFRDYMDSVIQEISAGW